MKRLAWFYVGFVTLLCSIGNANGAIKTIDRWPTDPWAVVLAVVLGLLSFTFMVMSGLCISQVLYQPRR